MRRVMVIIAGIWLLTWLTLCHAEEFFDFRKDSTSYFRKIAELNVEIEKSEQNGFEGDRRKKTPKTNMILFKTKQEMPMDDVPFHVQCVVYGPNGYSVLVCDNPEMAIDWLLLEGATYAELDSNVEGCSVEENASQLVFHSWAAESLEYEAYIQYANQWGSDSASVAIIDSGVCRHSMINPKLNSLGYDYIDNDTDPTNDLNGHGTRVAGIVADCTQGLPVSILPIRVLDADANGKTSNVVSAVLEATQAGVDVINLSLATFSQSEMLEDAIRNAVASGIIVVAAAGNYACDAKEVTPAKMTDSGVIIVGSADKDGSRSSFSNYGTSVDVYCYGRDIMSCSRSGGYVSDSGTSMAAPHVSALSAMVKLIHPSTSPEDVELRITTAATADIGIPSALTMIPRSLGFHLTNVKLSENGVLRLPVAALPATSLEEIQYSITNEGVVGVDEGIMKAEAVGCTKVTAHCTGFADEVFTVTVFQGNRRSIQIPKSVLSIEDDAFFGIDTELVNIPPGVHTIGEKAFDDGEIFYISLPDSVKEIKENNFSYAVILCEDSSYALEYALEHKLQYVVTG